VGKVFDGIDPKLEAWIVRQRMFFVGTAPSGDDGHVNVSPKGPIESLRIFGPKRVGYVDLVGSGVETVAHLHENGRIVIMLCAFEGPPRVVRLHGRGEAIQVGDPRFGELEAQFDVDAVPAALEAARAVVVVELERVADSCGFGVPLMRYEGERPQQLAWIDRKLRQGEDALMDYAATRNAVSIDGLPALDAKTLPRRGSIRRTA
jgi:Pyridoxamine 5'-phosphate oxidase